MNIDNAKNFFEKINSTMLKSRKEDLFDIAISYARIRTDWNFKSSEEKMADEELRTRTHNTLIDACNILSREMIKVNEDASWRLGLGNDRKEIGDFACYVHLFLGLFSR